MSRATLTTRRFVVNKLLWFLRHRKRDHCGKAELRAFLHYVTVGHDEPGGRWGNPRETRPVKPGTVVTYYNILRTLGAYLVEEEALPVSPMDGIKPPIDRPDQVQPFSDEQVSALFAAAKAGTSPWRDTAILYLLWDTGMRASELCGLRVRDVDLAGMRCTVEGKGRKARTLPFGRRCRKAIFDYLKRKPRRIEDSLFAADRGHRPGEPLQRGAITQLLVRLGREAGVTNVRCSPHTFRHTFAVSFLRNGGNQYSLMALLGHESPDMTQRYVKLAQADVERQHRAFSPADRAGRKNATL